jgi:hypothetical protein
VGAKVERWERFKGRSSFFEKKEPKKLLDI